MSLKKEVLNPVSVRCRQSIIPDYMRNVLDEADRKDVKVIYHTNVTPFGTFPVAVEITDEPQDK